MLEHDHRCSSNSSYAHNDPAHTTRRTEVRLSRVAARAGHDLGHCCCGWAKWGLVERESEVAVRSSCPGVKMVEWASKRSASIGVSAADGMASCRRDQRTRASPLPYLAIALPYTTNRHCRNAFLTDLPVQRLHSALECIAICAVPLSERAAIAIRSAIRYCDCSASAVCCGPALIHVIVHHGQVCSYERALRPPSFRKHVFQQLRLQLPVRAAELCATVPLLPDRATSKHICAVVAPVPAGTSCACEPDHRLSIVLGTILRRLEHWLRLCARQQLERPQLQLWRHERQWQSSC